MKYIYITFISISTLFAQVNIEGMRNNDLDTSNLSFEFDSDLEKTNEEDFELSSLVRYDHLFENKATFLVILENEYKYQKDDESKDVVDNKGLLHLRYVYPLNNISIESFVQSEFDDFRLILNRNLFGVGVRYNKNTMLLDSLFYGFGLMYEFEKYDVDPSIEKTLTKSTNYITFSKQLNPNIHLGSTSYIQFDISDVDQYRILNISQIGLQVSENINITFNMDVRYEPKPVIDSIENMYGNFSIGVAIFI